ncbi:hypothetical protein SAMN05444372_11040 [Flavobacterium micromati]|jgi:hypothetical protein|uniref:Uncharacterized protein n=1 Tax=Flavobacterium micromati TaxID=229205 RepID=A0A1M5MVA3_9FLAO|nr:hypothetical protein SAMN05444372_11040 [Flavobacterium micromati]
MHYYVLNNYNNAKKRIMLFNDENKIEIVYKNIYFKYLYFLAK